MERILLAIAVNATTAGLQWGHDLAVMERRSQREQETQEEGFNGAMTLQSWRVRVAPLNSSGGRRLQWGHDLAVMER
ncbi:MAG: hypothetical protein OXC13_06520, partial [Caldilineaceae bacterium]|nr:hypothetical protein [Caldilineaceae bacterium]